MNINNPTLKGDAPLAGSAAVRAYESSCQRGGSMLGLVSLIA